MFRYLVGGGSMQSYIINILLSLPVIFISLSAHEAAHGLAAWRLGDPTARNLGRLTLNPIRHLDPIGFVSMLLVGFGWAKPVPINSRYFKKPQRDIALVGAAGPLANLILSFVFLLLLRFLGFGVLANIPVQTQLTYNLIYFTLIFLYMGVYMNLTLAVFNLLPIPPLDGSRIFYIFLPKRVRFKILQYERQITLIFLLIILFEPFGLLNMLTSKILSGMFALVGMSGFLI